ncbi:hypothetical protein PsorP6_004021 [Peronosclerospora sorghi]|uniref:Uncharacterized protein n=1 Tax=Peronosclerospora sorghi TaxID=230839 RepID=A0ACC0VNE8_9STRA|nr:hypothetical protein PsorP6_004021 [Peronosclerospora sorghi]
MQTFVHVLLATVVVLQFSFSSTLASDISASSGSLSSSSELEAIAECNTTQLDEAETIFSTNQREKQCETALNLRNGTMLQVTTASATDMCGMASCKAALQELYNVLPDCRYNLWGLQHSAKKLLEFCGITPTNTAKSTSNTNGSVGWSVASAPASFAPVGVTDAPSPSTASDPTVASSASSRSSVTTITNISAACAFLIAALLG